MVTASEVREQLKGYKENSIMQYCLDHNIIVSDCMVESDLLGKHVEQGIDKVGAYVLASMLVGYTFKEKKELILKDIVSRFTDYSKENYFKNKVGTVSLLKTKFGIDESEQVVGLPDRQEYTCTVLGEQKFRKVVTILKSEFLWSMPDEPIIQLVNSKIVFSFTLIHTEPVEPVEQSGT